MVSTVWTACYAVGLPNLQLPLRIFGGYDLATNEGFLLLIPGRDTAILMSLIIQLVRRGTEKEQ